MLQFRDLQDALRKILWERIDSGELTGMALAEKTGFRQAHISNFLNRKRGLSLEGMDRVLKVEELSVLDLAPAAEINERASIPPPREDDYANILLVATENVANPQVHAREVREVLKFKQSFLRRIRPSADEARKNWLRFVMMRPSRLCVEAMRPRLTPNSTLLLDRHYNSLEPYRRGEPNMYAVRNGGEILVRYARLDGDTLVLRPENAAEPVRLVRLPEDTKAGDVIVGRVAYVSMEV